MRHAYHFRIQDESCYARFFGSPGPLEDLQLYWDGC